MSNYDVIGLQKELNDSLIAIDVLTHRLINIAVIENKLIEERKKMETLKLDCVRALNEIEQIQEQMKQEFNDNRYFFSFRYKWIGKLIMKHKKWW